MVELVQRYSAPRGEGQVLVFHNDDTDGVPQPGSFSCCPLGACLYHRHALPLYELIEFTLELPCLRPPPERICCTGMVVDCTFEDEPGLFHIHLTFIDLPDEARRHLEALTFG